MDKMKNLYIDNQNTDPDGITLKEWFIHMRQWIMVCPLFGKNLHIYTGRMSSPVRNCLVCNREIIEEVDEEEIKFDNRFSELMKEFNLDED